MSDDEKDSQNVVRLGTETLFALGEELRRMYDADLRSKPSVRLERLMRWIERGELERGDKPSQPGPVGPSEHAASDE